MSILLSFRFDSEDFCRATEAIVKAGKNVGKPHEKIDMTLRKEYWKYSRKRL